MNTPTLLRRAIGALSAVIIAALLTGGAFAPLIIALQTGRLPASATEPAETNFTSPTQITQHSQPTQATDAVLSFPIEELAVPAVNYDCAYRPDLSELMAKETELELTGDGPRVLIVHTHTTESYRDTEDHHSLDEAENMLSIGDEVARVLELGGIEVIHDRTIHDYPSYSGAYAAARDTIKGYLEAYPTIQLVLDLHRDAASDDQPPLTTSATVDGQECTQLMMVVGTDAGGNAHPGWQDNLSLALKLTALLEWANPGITRPVNLRSQRFNMDLSPGSLLVEVGAAGDSHQAAILAANALAQAILLLDEL